MIQFLELDTATQKMQSTALILMFYQMKYQNYHLNFFKLQHNLKIDEKYYEMVENIDLIKEVSKYKNDCIDFKRTPI